ncbi:MAG: hypothetical protein FWD94_03875 [Treponema sp.]|nr:hypothetical protein [Treponema sp.]
MKNMMPLGAVAALALLFCGCTREPEMPTPAASGGNAGLSAVEPGTGGKTANGVARQVIVNIRRAGLAQIKTYQPGLGSATGRRPCPPPFRRSP